MMKSLSLLLALALLSVLLCAHVAQGEQGNLVVSKDFKEDYVVLGKNLTVTFTFHNVGDGAARDIFIEDKTFPADTFELIEGSYQGSVPLVPSGENATLSFVVVPIRLGEHRDESATLTYLKSEDAEPTVAFSSFIGTVFILSETEYQNFYAEHTTDWIVFFVLALLPIGAPYFMYLQLQPQAGKQKSN